MRFSFKALFRRLPSFSARFHVAFGLSSLVTSMTLASVFLGLVPDRQSAIANGRLLLAEAVATSTSMMLRRSDMSGISSSIDFLVSRNADLDFVELYRQNDKSTVRFGAIEPTHSSELQPVDTAVRVPLMRGEREWGELRFGFRPLEPTGWRASLPQEPFALLLFMGLLSLPLFYLYLGRMLKELNPSAAVPSRVRSALDTIAESLIVIDRRGNVVLANAAFAELAGRTPEELIGVEAKNLAWGHHDDEILVYPWLQSLETAEATRHEMQTFRDANGVPRKFIVNCSPVAAAKGRVGGVLMSMDDVTLLEEKEVQLRQSMQVAEEANRAKSDFLSTMSHEIRTPMTAILGFTEVLRRGNARTDEERHRHLGTIASSGKHLLELINDVLDLSKVESGAMEVERIPTQPVQLMHDVVEVLSVKAREKGIGLNFEHPDLVPESVLSDPARLRQIITNLVGNAIKFTDQGEVVISLTFELASQEMSYTIRDTGIGMSLEQQDTIFDAFTQADASITRRFGGTGLGLSISRQLSQALGGDVSVSSVVSEGSTFRVVLPTGPLESVPMLSRHELRDLLEASRAPAAGNWSFPDAEILVVDDGAENRELLSLLLSDLDIRTTTARNGREAIDCVKSHNFDAVIMDIHMPVMDGYEAVGILRETGYELPVIALTANAMKGYEERILSAGFSHYQTKPIDIDRLSALLAELLNGQRYSHQPKVDVDVERQATGTVADDICPIVSTLSAENARFIPIVDQFMAKLDQRLTQSLIALENQDWNSISEFAHWLKGSGGTVGFDCLRQPAKRLESAARETQQGDAETELHVLLGMSARLVSEGVVTKAEDALSCREIQADTPVVSTLIRVHPKFESVVDRFIVRLGDEMDDLKASLRTGNMDAIAQFAHWLKGSGGNVGFEGFVMLASALEQAARDGNQQAVADGAEAVQAYTSRVNAGWKANPTDSRAA